MAESLDDPEFFLPTHFLDDVVLHNTMDSTSGFLTEFPYEFDSCGSNSVLSSPVESEGSSSDEDFLAALTRRFALSSIQQNHNQTSPKLSVPTFTKEKPEWVMSGSPQSTLSGIGSWSSNGSPTGPSSQVPSPPTTPFGDQNDTWDLIYAAAGQVARLKMTSGGDGPTKFTTHNLGLVGPPRRPSPQPPCVKNPSAGICHNQGFSQFHHVNKPQCSGAWESQVNLPWPAAHHQQQIQHRGLNIGGCENGRCGHSVNLTQAALQAQHHQNRHQQRSNIAAGRPIPPNGSHVKRESAGTGVFLPRRYNNPPAPEPRRKQGCQTVLLPAKLVQALNLNFEDMNGQAPPRFTTGLTPDHVGFAETLLARRNALLIQQRRNALGPERPFNCEVRLPQEWTY